MEISPSSALSASSALKIPVRSVSVFSVVSMVNYPSVSVVNYPSSPFQLSVGARAQRQSSSTAMSAKTVMTKAEVRHHGQMARMINSST